MYQGPETGQKFRSHPHLRRHPNPLAQANFNLRRRVLDDDDPFARLEPDLIQSNERHYMPGQLLRATLFGHRQQR